MHGEYADTVELEYEDYSPVIWQKKDPNEENIFFSDKAFHAKKIRQINLNTLRFTTGVMTPVSMQIRQFGWK